MSRKYLKDRALSSTKSESEEQEQIRLVESPEPEDLDDDPIMDNFLDHGPNNDHFYTQSPSNVLAETKPKKITIDRAVMTQSTIYPNKYTKNHDPYISGGRIFSWNKESAIKKCKCNPKSVLFSLFPILSWLPNYEWKFVHCDLIAGFMVGVMNIPQGMAYAMLGNLKPIVGIYMAFFPIFIYILMGTSRHISMGTFAVICLMSGKAVMDYQAKYPSLDVKPEDYIMAVTTALSFAVGIWQVLMGIFRLGALSLLLNAELVSGFTTGAAVHVFTSQVKSLLGISIPKRSGIFKIILSYVDIGEHIGSSNSTACIISIITLSVLVIYNELLRAKWNKRIPIPLPIELVAIIVGTLVSKYFNFHEVYKVAIVGDIPTSFPRPDAPDFQMVFRLLFPDGLLICIVAYAISISMAKIFAVKHNYSVDANQELIAQGASNFFGSFFSCAPISASLSRSLIQDGVGGRTQLASLFSCFLLVFVLLWIGPFFETLPNCILSAIIVVALKGMFLQVPDFFKALRVSKLNALIWFSTCVSTIVLDIEYGLAIGLVLSIVSLVWRSNKPNMCVLGSYKDTDLYVELDSSNHVKEISRIKIIKYTGSLNFATHESFTCKINKMIPLTSEEDNKNHKNALSNNIKAVNTSLKEKMADDSIDDTFTVNNNDCHWPPPRVEWVILDMSSMSSIDPAGAKAINTIHDLCASMRIRLLLSGCPAPVLDVLNTCNVLLRVGFHNVFASVHDAVINCGNGHIEAQNLFTDSTQITIPPHLGYINQGMTENETDSEMTNSYKVFESSIKQHNQNISGVGP